MQKQEEKDIVWLPKSLAEKVKNVTDDKALEREILSYVEETGKYLRGDVEAMEEQIVVYKAQMIKARNAFKEAKDAELDAMYSLWEKYEEDLSKVKKLVAKGQEILKPLLDDMKQMQSLANSVDQWSINALLETIQKFATLYGEQREVFSFLLENYKKPTPIL